MTVELHGYRYSVYTRIAQIALLEKGVKFTRIEVDPFQEPVPDQYRALHPFLRVPALVHDDFILYETSAITRYVDEYFSGSPLQPDDPRQRARMSQIISVIDNYGYWPMVRQVASQRLFRQRFGEPVDETELRLGLKESERVLDAIEQLSSDHDFLVGDRLSLCDFHLVPMMSYFAMTSEGSAVLSGRSSLSRWWKDIQDRPSVATTDPGLPRAQT